MQTRNIDWIMILIIIAEKIPCQNQVLTIFLSKILISKNWYQLYANLCKSTPLRSQIYNTITTFFFKKKITDRQKNKNLKYLVMNGALQKELLRGAKSSEASGKKRDELNRSGQKFGAPTWAYQILPGLYQHYQKVSSNR